MSAIYNSQDEAYKTPFGAVKTNEEVTFTLRVPQSFFCKTPYLFLQPDGCEAKQLLLQPAGTENGCDLFRISLRLQDAGVYFYWFDLYTEYRKLYAGMLGQSFMTTGDGAAYQLTVYDPKFTVPKQAPGGMMYQIFPDRFREGNATKPHQFNDRIYRKDKRREPYFWPLEMAHGHLTMDYFGGDLLGIEQRLSYLKTLGVTWIYLNPIFEAHANHRYNTADYMKIDPYLGTNADFARLCKKANEMGMYVLLDGVFSHTGSDSLYFNREGRYPTTGAWQGLKSPYRNWYKFHADGTYDSWWGFDTLPACNKQNPEFRRFICGEGGVIEHWLRLGASGFRLDVADELPDDFIEEIRAAVKRCGNDKLLIGEVWEDASNKEAYGVRRKYFLGNELDGVMNYPFRNAILRFLHDKDASQFAHSVMTICEHYPPPALSACTTHLSTHDTERAITVLADEPTGWHDRNWQSGRRLNQSGYEYGIQLMQLAFVLQFTMPGIPCLYYGDEVGMQGYKDPFNRAYFDWHSSETRLIELTVALSGLRSTCPVFADGRLHFTHCSPGVLCYERKNSQFIAAIAVNCSSHSAMVTLLNETVEVPPMGYTWRCDKAPFSK